MAVLNGTDITIYIPTDPVASDDASTTWEPVALSTSASLSISVDTPDASNKDSSGWSEVIGGQKSWTMSFDGLVDYSISGAAASMTQANVIQLFEYMNGRDKIKVAFGKDASFFYGDGFINSLEQSADNEATVTYSGSIQGSGALTLLTSGDIDASGTYPN